jgi:peptidoglycan/xylan/chitin deacetylase (PgdA/CDA1 family)
VSPARALAAAALAVAAAQSLPATAKVSAPVRRLIGVPARLGGGAVALTFDDGPHPAGTPAVLDLLEEAGARATFFLVGEQVREHPGLAAEVARRGHEIAVHCDRHRNLLRLSPGQVRDDLRRAAATIEEATGRSPRHYRPPYGVLSGPALAVARRAGWLTVLWSRDGRDWEHRATPESVAGRLRGAGPGDVVLLHDADDYSSAGSWRTTTGALPAILDDLAGRGLAVVGVGEAWARAPSHTGIMRRR